MDNVFPNCSFLYLQKFHIVSYHLAFFALLFCFEIYSYIDACTLFDIYDALVRDDKLIMFQHIDMNNIFFKWPITLIYMHMTITIYSLYSWIIHVWEWHYSIDPCLSCYHYQSLTNIKNIPCLFHSHTSRWRHNGRDSDSNHQPHGCLLNRLFRRGSRKTSKLRVTGLCVGNSPGTGEFPA